MRYLANPEDIGTHMYTHTRGIEQYDFCFWPQVIIGLSNIEGETYSLGTVDLW